MQDKEVRDSVLAEMEGDGLSQAKVAKEAGISPASLSQWLNGRYSGSEEAIGLKLEMWLQSRRQRDEVAIPEAPAWIEIPTAVRILTALRYAQQMQDLTVIYGAAGVGKTTAAEYFAAHNPNVWIVTMAPATSSSATCLEEVCLNLSVEPSGGAAKMQRLLLKRLGGTRGLLIIDEAQHLSIPALESLRFLHDKTKVGLAFVGNHSVYARLNGEGRAAHFAQLFSRIGVTLSLLQPTEEDIQAMATAWSIGQKKERDVLGTIGSSPGALRSVVKTLRMAAMLAKGEAKEHIDSRHLTSAWNNLTGKTG